MMMESGKVIEIVSDEELRNKKEFFSEFTKTFIDNESQNREKELTKKSN